MDLGRKIRKVERCTGCDISIVYNENKQPVRLETNDWELRGRKFSIDLGAPSQHERNLKALQENIYHERAKEKYRLQKGKCASCGRDLKGSGECDHIVTRAKGRNDSLSNLRILCGPWGGCDEHRKKHGNAQKKQV